MKKISYIICLTAILCSCNNELPIENVQSYRLLNQKKIQKFLVLKIQKSSYQQ